METVLPTIVINLDKRVDRWHRIHEHLIPFRPFLHPIVRMSAVECPEDPGKGCRESHRNALLMAKENDWDWVLVLEDDAILRGSAGNWCHEVKSITQSIQSSGIVFLGPGRIAGASSHVDSITKKTTLIHLMDKANRHMTGSHAILYHNDIYDQCIDKLDDAYVIAIYKHVDLALSNILEPEQVFAPLPFLAEMQDTGVSDVRKDANLTKDKELLLETEARFMGLLEKLKKRNQQKTNTL